MLEVLIGAGALLMGLTISRSARRRAKGSKGSVVAG
jgi:hypothetical protein